MNTPYKILIVDDEPDLKMLLKQKFRKRLQSGELEFFFAENGEVALNLLATEGTIDMVFSDINMPVMDGLTLLNRIKESNLLQKTVVVSAYGDINNIRTAMNRGAFDFVMKPIDMNDFEITLDKTILETEKMKRIAEMQVYLDNERMEKEMLIVNQNKMLEEKVAERTQQLIIEKKKSDDLLLNILPEEVAEELKQYGKAEAKHYEEVTVLFTDFVNFTGISETLTPKELVDEIGACFSAFDNITERNRVEKIKTIGDAFMAVCGLPEPLEDHAKRCANAALEMLDFMKMRKQNGGKFDVRIGLHSGPVIAGIVGSKKFSYDIWGDTVNFSARMEQNSQPGKINISGATYEMIKDEFACEYRGKIEAKNKGEVDMYFITGKA